MAEQPQNSARRRNVMAITSKALIVALLIVAALMLTIITEPEPVINNIGKGIFDPAHSVPP